MKQKRRLTKSKQCLERLKAYIASCESAALPPLRQLAREFGVSHSTVVAAARMLRDKGVLTLVQGARARIVGREEPPKPPARNQLTSKEKLARYIEHQIETGELRAGNRLPKVKFYVLDHYVSERTVLDAFTILAQRGQIRPNHIGIS